MFTLNIYLLSPLCTPLLYGTTDRGAVLTIYPTIETSFLEITGNLMKAVILAGGLVLASVKKLRLSQSPWSRLVVVPFSGTS